MGVRGKGDGDGDGDDKGEGESEGEDWKVGVGTNQRAACFLSTRCRPRRLLLQTHR